MKKKFFSFGLLAAAATIGFLNAPTSVEEFSALELANIEALSTGEITVVGCMQMNKSTCYVFDGNGQLVDKQKNQYPGK